MIKKTYNPCDDCQYSYSRNNQESGMCKICELNYFKDRQQIGWTRFKDRPPELLQEVLCYRGDFNGDLMNTYTYLGGGMWKDDYGINYRTEEDGITRWMPLPEPPKRGII